VHHELQKCAPNLNTCGTLEEVHGAGGKKINKSQSVTAQCVSNYLKKNVYCDSLKGGRLSLGQFHDIITGRLRNMTSREKQMNAILRGAEA